MKVCEGKSISARHFVCFCWKFAQSTNAIMQEVKDEVERRYDPDNSLVSCKSGQVDLRL